MIQRLAYDMTQFLLDKKIVKEDDREIYSYGFEAMISTAVNTIIVVAIGIISGLFSETLLFLLSFALLRVYCGGYHAKTHIGCILTFAGIYGVAMVLTVWAESTFPKYLGTISLIMGLICLAVIFVYAPIEHKNRPFVDNEYKSFKLIARIVATAQMGAIICIPILYSTFSKMALIMSLAMSGVVFILALAKIIERKR